MANQVRANDRDCFFILHHRQEHTRQEVKWAFVKAFFLSLLVFPLLRFIWQVTRKQDLNREEERVHRQAERILLPQQNAASHSYLLRAAKASSFRSETETVTTSSFLFRSARVNPVLTASNPAIQQSTVTVTAEPLSPSYEHSDPIHAQLQRDLRRAAQAEQV